MKNIKKYNEFVNEAFEDNIDYRIGLLFDEIMKRIKIWIKEGRLKKYELQYADKDDKGLGLRRGMSIKFSNQEYLWDIAITVEVEEAIDNKVEEFFLKIKKYTQSNQKLVKTFMDTVKLKKLTPEFLIDTMEKMEKLKLDPNNPKQALKRSLDPDTLNDNIY